MLTGNEATWQIGGDFVDNKSLKPESVSSEYWFTIQRTVDTGKTINEIRDKDKLKDLSGYYTNIDWSRTEYKRRGLSDE